MASPTPPNISFETESARGALDALLAKLRAASSDSAPDPIKGTSGNDTLAGTDEPDEILGRSGDDEISGGEGADSLDGGSGDDLLLGEEGDDRLRGGSGDDSIEGGEGDDEIKAGSGDDEIDGGEGDDAISTGSGADRLTFAGDFGDDVVSDFRPGTDVIDLTAFGDITSLDQLTFTEQDGDTVITADGLPGSITVKGATAAELKDGMSVEVACYLRGTMVLTPKGERPIEALAIGDEVTTADGAARRIRWIGYRSFATRFLRPGSRMLPVTVLAGALGEAADGAPIPRRDLRVSPGHSVLVDGVFVNADLLIDGETVLREAPGGEVSYVHVELDSPDALIADGAASETYVNDGNRRQFENWRSYVLRYGEDHPAPRDGAGRVAHRYPHVEPAALAALREALQKRSVARRQTRRAA